MDHQVAVVELFAETAANRVFRQRVRDIGITGIEQTGVGAACYLGETVLQNFATARNINRQLHVVQHGIVLAGQSQAVDPQGAFIGPDQVINIELGFQFNGYTGLASHTREGCVIQRLEFGHGRHG